MKQEVNFNSVRTKKARFSTRYSSKNYKTLYGVALGLLLLSAIAFSIHGLSRIGYLSLAIALFLGMIVVWYYRELSVLKPNEKKETLDDILSAKLLAFIKDPISPQSLWDAAMRDWPGHFICSHLQLDPHEILSFLSTTPADASLVWKQALVIVDHYKAPELDSGILATSLMVTSPVVQKHITEMNLKVDDILEVHGWLFRLQTYMNLPKPNYGGIGRDWASGFIPTLEKYSQNISNTVEYSGSYAHFLSHADVITHIIANLDKGTPVSLVGPPGTGKTSLIFGLAEKLLEGEDSKLRYYQIISLNASAIIAAGIQNLERLMLTIFGEAIHAGNIILFLDEAQLFFSEGVGAFNMTQLLLPVLQNRRIKIIAAFSPNSWQHLRAADETLAANFSTIIIPEPPMTDTLKVMEDRAIQLEHRDKVMVSYEGIREAYRLSGQYMQEFAYPGKGISLLEQAMPYATKNVVTAVSIQTAIERMRGIRVSAAKAPEADVLLHLEDRIHQRMINQERAVNVVASALRRSRAGVANPKRPVGSFLFLGPTGVGKTELARSLAATYFGDEKNMVRLDMSEYQRPEDVARLLSIGQTADHTLLMSIRETPFSVVLFDEVEKAHPQILNLLLQILDEGQLTDDGGKPASFRNAIIITTSNAGSADITARVHAGGKLDDFERPLIDKLIADGQFKPELINRYDEIVLFRPLDEDELARIAELMLGEVNKTLSNQNITVKLTPEAMKQIVHAGYDPQFGARPMRRIIQKTVEDAVAIKILKREASPGSTITLDAPELAEFLKR